MANTNATPKNVYNAFWMIYRNKSKKYPVFPRYLSFETENPSDEIVKVTLKEPIHFIGWKYKSSSQNKNIDILMDASEDLLLDNLIIIQSKV